MQFLKTEQKDNYTIVTLSRGKSNPMNQEMINEFRALMDDLKTDDKVQGVIVTGQENFFSVGLDVVEVHSKDEAGLVSFWKDFNDLIIKFATFPKPLIAAITGHSPAGGTVLAIGCDYRVMAKGKYQIGLNEIAVGITLPKIIFDLYAFWLGQRKAYQNLMEARMMMPDEALADGLVDEVVDASEVLPQAEAKMKTYLSFSQASWTHSKASTRKELLDKLQNVDFDKDFNQTLEDWWLPENRAAMGKVVEMLKGR